MIFLFIYNSSASEPVLARNGASRLLGAVAMWVSIELSGLSVALRKRSFLLSFIFNSTSFCLSPLRC